jgi:hypothetical protein
MAVDGLGLAVMQNMKILLWSFPELLVLKEKKITQPNDS